MKDFKDHANRLNDTETKTAPDLQVTQSSTDGFRR